jgi:hypothetical protein
MTQHREGYRQPGNRDERLPSASICPSREGKGMAGTSRVNREVYARFCGRLVVKFHWPTRQTVR